MTDAREGAGRDPLVLATGEGRTYPMGRLSAVFKAGGPETAGRYSVVEWWLDPHTRGPHAHHHPEDDVFLVLEGTLDFLVRDEWVNAPAGSFVLVPGGVTHTFENRGGTRAAVLTISGRGDFEDHLPAIADRFINRPARDADC